ncbi:MAG: TraR/DksA family transcriptional regulator [Pseudomonadota bacterium]
MSHLSTRKTQLDTRLTELRGRLGRIEDHLEQTPNPDWEDRAQEAEMDEVLEELGEAGTQEVTAIKAALKRIENGTYGVCVRCGNAILEERLNVLPHTPICKTCAATLAKRS